MKNKKWKIYEEKSDIAVLAGLVLLFGYFFFFHPVRELSDSFQYLNQLVSREPVYALLLQLLTGIFKEAYTIPLGILQNTLAVICIYWLYRRLRRLFFTPVLSNQTDRQDLSGMHHLSGMCPVFLTATLLALVAPHLITPLVSQSGLIITNSVLTEGIAISLYYVWFGMLLSLLTGYYGEKENKVMVITLLFSTLLSMIRGQLMICILVWAIVTGFIKLREKKGKQLLIILLGLVLSFGEKGLLTKYYNYLESGFFVNTTSSAPMMLANVIYLADTEDGDRIQEEGLRLAFENMVMETQKRELSIENASGSFISRAQFHEEGHETINFDCIVPQLNAYILEKEGIDESTYSALLIQQDKYAGEIFSAVLPRVMPQFIKNYFVIASLGFVRSVAMDISFLPVFAVAVYLGSLVLLVILLCRNRKSPGAFFMLLVLLCICGTVFGTSIMIECISRYMIYNLPLFYIAGMAMLTEWNQTKGRKDKKQL